MKHTRDTVFISSWT